MRIAFSIAVAALLLISCGTDSSDSSQNELKGAMADLEPGAGGVQILNLTDGSGISVGQKVKFQVKGMENVAPGTVEDGSGHFHVLFNHQFVEKGLVIDDDMEIKHMCLKGEAGFDLPEVPEKFVIAAQFVDGEHRSYGKEYSQAIKVFLEQGADSQKTQ